MTLRSHPDPEARGCSWEEPPTPEARAGGLEEQPEECWLRRRRKKPRGAILHRRLGAAAERDYSASEASGGREETPHV